MHDHIQLKLSTIRPQCWESPDILHPTHHSNINSVLKGSFSLTSIVAGSYGRIANLLLRSKGNKIGSEISLAYIPIHGFANMVYNEKCSKITWSTIKSTTMHDLHLILLGLIMIFLNVVPDPVKLTWMCTGRVHADYFTVGVRDACSKQVLRQANKGS